MTNAAYRYFLFLFAIVALSCLNVAAQNTGTYKNYEFCSDRNWSNGNKTSFKELRETTIPATRLLTVDADRNGGIKVIGENRSDIAVRACIQAWADSDSEAQSRVKNVRIETAGTVRAVNSGNESNWSVSYEILVPRSTDLKLSAYNGGISIRGVEGNLDFETHNGGISVQDASGNVRGRTQNGGIAAKLSGARWNGSGLNLETQNGGVSLEMPRNYATRLETRTVNGGFKSDFDITMTVREWQRGVNINTDINGGGAPVRVVTTNGGVRISSSN